MAQAQAQTPRVRVFVYEYMYTGFIGTTNCSERENTVEYNVKDAEAVIVPTVALAYVMKFDESQSWRREEIKIVVVDRDEKRFREVVERIRRLLNDDYSVEDLLDIVDEVFERNEYSYSKLIHEMNGYTGERLVYLLNP